MDISDIIRLMALSALPILIAITFHEVAHGFVANRLGDPTAKMLGRLTLNPLAHIDIFGTIILPFILIILNTGIVFGYAKPVPINPMNFRKPRQGMAISAAAGPVTNILLAVASVILSVATGLLAAFSPEVIKETILAPLNMMLTSSAVINIVLAVFNMIPIPPLDGGRVLVGLLPSKQAMLLSRIEPFGFMIVLVLIYSGMANYIIMPFISFLLKLLQVH